MITIIVTTTIIIKLTIYTDIRYQNTFFLVRHRFNKKEPNQLHFKA